MKRYQANLLRYCAFGLSATILVACGGRSDRAPIEKRGTASAAQPAPGVTTGADGIRNYGDYQAAVSSGNESVSAVANRIGLSAAELGAYNGLAPTHVLQPGDELVLPPRPGGYGAAAAQAGTQATSALPSAAAPSIEAAPIGSGDPFGEVPVPDASIPETGETWSPDLAAAAIARATGIDDDGQLAAPLSANDPLPENPTTPDPLLSPELQQYQTQGALPTEPVADPAAIPTPASPELAAAATAVTAGAEATTEQPAPEPVIDARSATALQRPVDGPIAIGYRRGAGTTRNDGVDFAAAPGSPVVAADAGEVALVSESLGGLGTIVLIRHQGDLLTVYGRVDGVSLTKGALVRRGEQIGVVAVPPSGSEGRMHFEVRRGAESLDPTRFIEG